MKQGLSFAGDIIDIYSNGWGPSDSGSTVIGPRRVTKLVLYSGVYRNGIEMQSIISHSHGMMNAKGRNGKGSIYVWANGNGGENDDCAADNYASSINIHYLCRVYWS